MLLSKLIYVITHTRPLVLVFVWVCVWMCMWKWKFGIKALLRHKSTDLAKQRSSFALSLSRPLALALFSKVLWILRSLLSQPCFQSDLHTWRRTQTSNALVLRSADHPSLRCSPLCAVLTEADEHRHSFLPFLLSFSEVVVRPCPVCTEAWSAVFA